VIGDALELRVGSELQTIQFLGRVTAFRPYGSVNLHVSPNTVVGYSYATALPNRRDDGFGSASAADSGGAERIFHRSIFALLFRASIFAATP